MKNTIIFPYFKKKSYFCAIFYLLKSEDFVADLLVEKTDFVQTYFANPNFQNFVNAMVFQAPASQLASQRI